MQKNETTLDYIKRALDDCGYTYHPQTGWTISRTTSELITSDSPSIMATKIWMHLEQVQKDIPRKERWIPQKDKILDSIALIENAVQCENINTCFNQIKHNPMASDTFETIGRLFAGDNYDPIYPAILRQILYAVKRKMLGRKVSCPILPIFYGSAGTGKSTFVKKLYGPLPAHKCSTIKDGEGIINKEKNTQQLADNYVLFIEEMGGMPKADLSKLKTLMDAEYLTYVPLYTNTQRQVFNRATLIGCSNTMVRNLLHSTGNNRKWVQLNFYNPPAIDCEDAIRNKIDALATFDYVNLWQSVDENGPEPFADPRIYEQYRAYVDKWCDSSTPTTDWIEEYIEEHSGEWVKKTTVYKTYLERCHTETKHMSKDNFYELLTQKGFKEKRKPDGDRCVIVPSKPIVEEF